MHSNNNILKSQVEELKRQLEKKDAELNDLKEETSMTSTSTIEKNNDDNPATASIIIAKDHEIEKLQSELNQLASAVKELKTEASETKGTQWDKTWSIKSRNCLCHTGLCRPTLSKTFGWRGYLELSHKD